MLEIRDLALRYGRHDVLRQVNLDVGQGEVVALLGPNGTGKSSLLKCLTRIERPHLGEIAIAGRPIASYSARALARVVATVPQQQQAVPMPVIDLVRLGRAPHRGQVNRARHDDVVISLLERFGLGDFALRLFSELSGGERQRVLLARALAQEPSLLLLDEPTSALDLRHQLDAMETVRRLADEQGIAVLVAIHDLALASRFADRMVLLGDGIVQAQGTWRDVLASSAIRETYGVEIMSGEHGGLPYVIARRTGEG